jgi:hypothetical protein
VIDGSGMYSLAAARRAASVELGVAAGDQIALSMITDGSPGAATSPVSIRLGTTRPAG